MKCLFATLSVFTMLGAMVLPVFADINAVANGMVGLSTASNISGPLQRVQVSEETKSSQQANSPKAENFGTQHYTSVQFLMHEGLVLAGRDEVRLFGSGTPEAVPATQPQPAVNSSTLSF